MTQDDLYLNSEELRLLTKRGASFFQIQSLDEMSIPYELDEYDSPLVKYEDAKPYLVRENIPLR